MENKILKILNKMANRLKIYYTLKFILSFSLFKYSSLNNNLQFLNFI